MLLFLACTPLIAQNPIPNSGFESWTGGEPDSWETLNLPPLYPVTQSNDFHAGSSAAKLEVVDDSGSPFPAVLSTGSIAISQNYLTLSFYYKSFLNSSDALLINVMLKKNGSPISITNNSISLFNNVYTQATFTLSYFQPVTGIADEASVDFSIGNSISLFPNIGSYVILDDVVLGGSATPTGIDEQQNALINSIGVPLPNPSSGFTLLPFSLSSKTKAVIELITIDGKTVREILHEEMEPGRYKAECMVDDLPAGLYLVKLSAGGKTAYNKLIVQ